MSPVAMGDLRKSEGAVEIVETWKESTIVRKRPMLILEVECEMESGEMLDEPEVALVCRRSKSSANEVINKTEHPAHEREGEALEGFRLSH